jgi:hypothetical protein
MSTKILIAVVIVLFTMIIASSIASLLPLTVPLLSSSLYCPSSHSITLESHSTFSLDQDRTGLYITCQSTGNGKSVNASEFLTSFFRIIWRIETILLIPAAFLYAYVIYHHKPSDKWRLLHFKSHYHNHKFSHSSI